LHAGPVISEQAHAERRHLGHRRQPFTGPVDGDGPATATSTAASRPNSSTSRTMAAESMAGSVLGMATTAV